LAAACAGAVKRVSLYGRTFGEETKRPTPLVPRGSSAYAVTGSGEKTKRSTRLVPRRLPAYALSARGGGCGNTGVGTFGTLALLAALMATRRK